MSLKDGFISHLTYVSLKSTFSGLQFCRWQYWSAFIHFAFVASQICDITRNSDKNWNL